MRACVSDACRVRAWCIAACIDACSKAFGPRCACGADAHGTCLLMAAATSSGVEGVTPLTSDASPATKAPPLDAAAAASGVAPTAAASAVASAAGSSVFCFLASCSLMLRVEKDGDWTARREYPTNAQVKA